jgi:Trk K+ transport system NAD-binding subunit
MKNLSAQIAFFLQHRHARRNVRTLLQLVAALAVMVLVFSIAFHLIMAAEGQEHSWLTGLYWTLTVMTTLGFGDITFHGDLGRAFSIVVLLSGVLFLLVLLPFTFIQFFYAPWMEAQQQLRAPRELPADTRGHVVLTSYDPVSASLIERLRLYDHAYVVMEPEIGRALELHDFGVPVMVGAPDDGDSYRRIRADQASLVVAGIEDFMNTNITFTVRELTDRTPIVAIAREKNAAEVLRVAGATHVLELAEVLGRSMARRSLGGETRANVVARFGRLVIAEAPVFGTPLAGKRVAETRLREATGVTVVGVWERGDFTPAGPETPVAASSVLLLAGTEEQLDAFDHLVVIYGAPDAPVLVIGGGRVGRAAAAGLADRGVPYRIIERRREMIRDEEHYVHGSAADLAVLERAGIRAAPTTIVTTNDDATNVFLTVYCRQLRPNMQIVARSTHERNISTLHRAGADIVMSSASIGADAILNVLERNDLFRVAEGLDVFRVPAPPAIAGRTLAESRIREETGCLVLAIEREDGAVVNPEATTVIGEGSELILIGTTESQRRFTQQFGNGSPER